MTEYQFYKRIVLHQYPSAMAVLALNEVLGAALTLLGIGSFIPLLGKILGGTGDVPGPIRSILEPVGILEWQPLQILYLLVAIGFLVIMLDMARTYIAGLIGVHVHASIKRGLNSAMETSTWERFSLLDQGKYMQCMIAESSLARGAVNDMAGALAFAFITILFLAWISLTSPFTFFVFVGFAAIFWLISRSLLREVRETAQKRIEVMTKLNTRVTDLRHVFKFLLAENRVTQIGSVIYALIARVASVERRQVFLSVIVNNLVALTGLALIASVTTIYLMANGSAGSALLFDAIVLQRISGYFSNFHKKRKAMLQKIPSYETCIEMMNAAGTSDGERGEGLPVRKIQEGIEFSGLSFRYSRGESVLTEVDLWLPPKGLVFFVGASGSGKTTAVDHVVGLLRTRDRGEIRCDGRPMDSLSREAWAALIAYVPQEAYIQTGTLREYLNSGDCEITDEAVWDALRRADADGVVARLGHELETWIESGGRELSGGERHRLSIARALVRDAKIIVLDEPSAALDKETEQRVFNTLKVMAGKRLVLVVTHSEHMSQYADIVYRFDGGRVVKADGKSGKTRAP